MTATTHSELTDRAVKWLYNNQVRGATAYPRYPYRCNIVLKEFNSSTSREVPDCIGWVRGQSTSVLIEVKASRSDFRNDRKKFFRRHSEYGIGRFRFYLCQKGVIEVDMLPEKWGLLYATEKRVKVVKRPEDFGDIVVNREFKFLLSALRRVRYHCLMDGSDFDKLLEYQKE